MPNRRWGSVHGRTMHFYGLYVGVFLPALRTSATTQKVPGIRKLEGEVRRQALVSGGRRHRSFLDGMGGSAHADKTLAPPLQAWTRAALGLRRALQEQGIGLRSTKGHPVTR